MVGGNPLCMGLWGDRSLLRWTGGGAVRQHAPSGCSSTGGAVQMGAWATATRAARKLWSCLTRFRSGGGGHVS